MLNKLPSRILATLALLAAFLLPATASAGNATDLVKAKQTQLFALVAKPRSSAVDTQLKALFDEMLSYDRFARDSLGEEWDKRSEDEKKRFSGLLTDLIRNNYKKNLKVMLDYNIEYVGEEAKNGGFLVKTLAKHKTDAREPNLEIDFQLETIGGKLQVVDIVTERASMVKGFRSQFLKILRKDGFAKLVEKMENKLKKG